MSTSSIGSGSTGTPCPTCGIHMETALQQIDTARRKLQLRQETLQTEQALLKADKRNFKRRLQAARLASANHAVQNDRLQTETEKAQHEAQEKTTAYQKLATEASEKNVAIDAYQRQIESLNQQLSKALLETQNNATSTDTDTTTQSAGGGGGDKSLNAEISRLTQELQDKETALESFEMQILELERDRDDSHGKNDNDDNDADDFGSNGFDKACYNCARTKQQLLQAERTAAELRESHRTEQSQLSLQLADLQDQILTLKLLPSSSSSSSQGTKKNSSDPEELSRLQTLLERCKSQEEVHLATIAQQQENMDTLKQAHETLQQQQQQQQQSTNDATTHSTVPQRPVTPNCKTHRHVMEWEWHGTEFSGIYTGWISNDSNIPDGAGTLRVDDGAVFDGEWLAGARDGQGVWATIDGDIYRGAWSKSAAHGWGVQVWSDGRVYRGDWQAGQRHGPGVMTWPYGAHYEGAWENDKRNGQGVYVYADGRCYTGEYREERPHGYGQLKAADGAMIYDGPWEFGEYLGGARGRKKAK